MANSEKVAIDVAQGTDKVIHIRIGDMVPNPMRAGKKIRLVQSKVEALQHSFKSAGVWPSIVVRENEDGVIERAFGEHRTAGAILEYGEDGVIPVILRIADDHAMVKMFGQENSTYFAADFYNMLESYQAAKQFLEGGLSHSVGKNVKALDIAKDLGWTRVKNQGGKGYDVATHEANACMAASELIDAGLHKMEFFENLTARQAMELLNAEKVLIKKTETAAAKTKAPRAEVDKMLANIASSTEWAGKQLKSGEIRNKDVSGKVEYAARQFQSSQKPKKLPTLNKNVNDMASKLYDFLDNDKLTVNLEELELALRTYTPTTEENDQIDGLATALAGLAARAAIWEKKFAPGGGARVKKAAKTAAPKTITQTTA